MGMFDNLKIRSSMLPLTANELIQVGDYHDWQTKDLECVLGIAEITDSRGLRFKNSFIYEDPEDVEEVFSTKPNRKEYHVYGNDVTDLTKSGDSDHYDNWGYGNRDGNRAIESKVKIHVLTSILDLRKNWCFDLKSTPANGPLKVIYENGTVKNIEFDGEFKEVELTKRTGYKYSVKPVGYRNEINQIN